MTEIATDILILNLYQNHGRKTGKFNLPDIENMVIQYKEDKKVKKIPQKNETKDVVVPTTSPPQPITTGDINQNQIVNETKINPIINNNSINNIETVQVNVESDTLKNASSGPNHEDIPIKEKEVKSPSFNNPEDLDRIILELYLEEIAEDLVKPPKKALRKILEPNIINIIEK